MLFSQYVAVRNLVLVSRSEPIGSDILGKSPEDLHSKGYTSFECITQPSAMTAVGRQGHEDKKLKLRKAMADTRPVEEAETNEDSAQRMRNLAKAVKNDDWSAIINDYWSPEWMPFCSVGEGELMPSWTMYGCRRNSTQP